MPRIDPLQLLKCLSVLLSPEGGILSREEVPRLVNLMTKFSKKLVSKCVYILILKNTEQSLVNLFMAEGGWNLIYTWLQDAVYISNWDLVKEILSLLLITPVDVERLKSNNIPKLVKTLSRLEELKGVQDLSSQLVQDWLAIVKGNTKGDEIPKPQAEEVMKTEEMVEAPTVENLILNANDTVDSSQLSASDDASTEAIPANTFYKVTVRDGKQVISRTASVESSTNSSEEPALAEVPVEPVESVEDKKEIKEKKTDDKNKSSDKDKSKSKSSSSSKHSSSSSRSKSSSSSKDRHKSSSSSSSKSSSRDKERDKDRDKDRRDKDRKNGAKSSSKSSSSSSNSKDKSDQKEKQAEKDKDTLAKIKPQSIDKLGRIPKKTDDKAKENKEIKKPTMSIEVRKNSEERPKTVKVYNSKRRSTGLEEEAKPPPPRPTKKPTVTLPTIPQKRPSPVKEIPAPPEKKFKLEIPERPGAIKLIPPKPKPSVLQESDIFMDALAASATSKKEPKKRKRRPSVTKETPGSPPTTPQEPQTPTSPVTSPIGLKNIAAPNFYQDTLQTDQSTEDSKEENQEEITERSSTPIENEIERPKLEGGLKGVLMYTKRKGPKKSVRFNDNNLTQVRFFELDETERVNVTRTFMDMAKMEMTSEREALQLSRKLSNEDVMEPQTAWRLPFIIDQADPLAAPGCKSLEKDIQFAREKSVLQALYFDKRKIPDSPEEPVPETHQISDPITIPLEDAESQEMDLRNTPWPEPKGSPPQIQENIQQQIFTNMPLPFQNFQHGGPPPFQGMPPRFGPQNGPGGVFGGPPNILPNGNMMGPPNMGGPPPDMMHQGPMNPNAFGPGPDNFNNPMMNDNNFQMPFNPPNMGMFPPNNFNMNRGGRGGFRRGGNNGGPWIRMNGPGPIIPGNWSNRGGGRGRLCKNVKNHGFCRNMDKCPFIHPK